MNTIQVFVSKLNQVMSFEYENKFYYHPRLKNYIFKPMDVFYVYVTENELAQIKEKYNNFIKGTTEDYDNIFNLACIDAKHVGFIQVIMTDSFELIKHNNQYYFCGNTDSFDNLWSINIPLLTKEDGEKYFNELTYLKPCPQETVDYIRHNITREGALEEIL